jgi:hypothetical protein
LLIEKVFWLRGLDLNQRVPEVSNVPLARLARDPSPLNLRAVDKGSVHPSILFSTFSEGEVPISYLIEGLRFADREPPKPGTNGNSQIM